VDRAAPNKAGPAPAFRRIPCGVTAEARQVQTEGEHHSIELQDIDPLSQRVQIWFSEATSKSKFEVPSIDSCRMVAFYILLLRDQEIKASDERRLIVTPAKALLKAVEPKYREAKYFMELASRPGSQPASFWVKHYKKVLSQIDEVCEKINDLILLLSEVPHVDWEPIRKLAAVAQQAWVEANNGRFPRSFNPDNPLCKFLSPALEAMNKKCAPTTISSILRNRRRRKSGRMNRVDVFGG
jgi:hypothetical protein